MHDPSSVRRPAKPDLMLHLLIPCAVTAFNMTVSGTAVDIVGQVHFMYSGTFGSGAHPFQSDMDLAVTVP